VTIAASLFALSLVMIVWSYLVYPPVVARFAGRAALAGASPALATREWSSGPRASIEVLVSAADEEAVIGERVANLLAQEVDGRYRVTIGCDGSADRTADLARRGLGQGGRVVEFPARRGKAMVLNDLVAASDADILVFTDANTLFEPGAVRRLANALEEVDVGAACGRLVVEGSDAESVFWDRETRLKEAEGKLGVCLGANGGIYAARRVQIEPLPSDTTIDDFLIPLRVARRGSRIVFVGDAVAREAAAPDARAEMNRRFRIGVGAGQVLRRELWLWNVARHPLLSFAYLSRKVARWLAPVAALAACVTACASPALRPVGIALLGSALLLVLSCLARPRPVGLPGRLYYFGVMNLALAAGVIAGLLGYRRPVWKPAARES
jgi:cellulose synthase/poly-beta-1,6-N-acetylglucosamine synthase-like glycosyltransferase